MRCSSLEEQVGWGGGGGGNLSDGSFLDKIFSNPPCGIVQFVKSFTRLCIACPDEMYWLLPATYTHPRAGSLAEDKTAVCVLNLTASQEGGGHRVHPLFAWHHWSNESTGRRFKHVPSSLHKYPQEAWIYQLGPRIPELALGGSVNRVRYMGLEARIVDDCVGDWQVLALEGSATLICRHVSLERIPRRASATRCPTRGRTREGTSKSRLPLESSNPSIASEERHTPRPRFEDPNVTGPPSSSAYYRGGVTNYDGSRVH